MGRPFLVTLVVLAACGPKPGPVDAGPVDAGVFPDGGHDMCGLLPEPTCATVPTFADLQPILMSRCQSCHNGSGTEWPLVSYAHVADWQDQVRSEIVRCTMPPLDGGEVITWEERNAIFTWVRCGRPK